MSSLFEQELRKLFGDGQIIQSPSFSGRVCMGMLGQDLRVRAQFITTGIADHYDAIKLTVLNRTDGPVDTLTLGLRDLLGRLPVPGNPNFPSGVAPHIWQIDGKLEWYAACPSPKDYETIRQAAARYLDVFRDRTQERSPGISGPDHKSDRNLPNTPKGRLQKRLEENYAAYMEQLTKKSFADLIDAAGEIAAARLICEALVPACSDSDAALLLRFDDPLELMRDRFLDKMDAEFRSPLDHALRTVRDKAEEFLADYVPARQQTGDGSPPAVRNKNTTRRNSHER